ncbi:4-coumarate--CoA ligase [Verticillium dahliae VDG2]|nr:4-coumarate--CoA ligase [Verticillium dahliae VDG2]
MAFLSAKWLLIASSQRLRRSSHAVSVVDQKTYVFGGELVPREPIDNQIDIIDVENENGRKRSMQRPAFAKRSVNPTVKTIPAPAEAPIPRVGSPSATINGSIWIFSGRGGIEMKPVEEQGALWRYEAGAANWSSVKPADPAAPYPAGRSYHCVASDGKSKLFVHSGCPETGRLADLWMFDTEERTWSELPSAPAPSRGGASIAYADGKLYRVNGFDGINEQGGSLDVFDIPSLSWNTISYNPDNMEAQTPIASASTHILMKLPQAAVIMKSAHSTPTALVIIDVQQAFKHPTYWGAHRSNPLFENNIAALLSAARAHNEAQAKIDKPQPVLIVHIHHHSTSPGSALHPSAKVPGTDILAIEPMEYVNPLSSEPVLVKYVNSGFIGTDLEARLRAFGAGQLIVTGLTTDHCVNTTVRMAANLQVLGDQGGPDGTGEGVHGIIVADDATATHPRASFDAETVHAVTLASLDGEFAQVRNTKEVIATVFGSR